MSGSVLGRIFKLSTFGESHGAALGGVIDGCPAGIKINREFIDSEMARRRPGSSELTTTRKEDDSVEILSGLYGGITTGSPIAFIVRNKNQKSEDYDELSHVFRPSHSDYTFDRKYGIRDPRGGGRQSGRETLSRVFAGAVAKLCLTEKEISVNAGLISVGKIRAEEYDWNPPFPPPLYAPENKNLKAMEDEILKARNEGDSVGGIVKCVIKGVPVGIGEPVFDKLDAEIAKAILSIGAVKGIEFGSGFEGASMRGSENNDQIRYEDGHVRFLSNNAGGILGGISNGDDIVFSVAVKPTPSISKEQRMINDRNENITIAIKGRHDPCVAVRVVPVVEAMSAITLLDSMLVSGLYG